MEQHRASKSKLYLAGLFGLLALAVLVFAACAGAAPATPAAPPPTSAPQVVEKTVVVQQTVVSEKVITATPAPTTAPPPTAAVKTTIRLAGFGPGEAAFQPIWNDIKATYEKLHPDITIELEGIAYENLQTQLIVEATGGTAPDIAQVDSLIDLKLAALGIAAPLEGLMSPTFKADLDPSLLENSSLNGHVYAIPQSGVPHILWENLDLAKQAGLDPQAPIKTWDDFEAAARAIAKLGKDAKGNQIYGFCVNNGGGLASLSAFQAFPVFASFGSEWFDADGKVNLSTPEAIAALTWLQKMAQDGVILKGVDIRDNRTLFAQGRCGFQEDNTGAVGIYRDLSGMGKDFDSHWRLVAWPAKKGDKGVGIYYAHTLVVFQQSKVKQQAVDFIQWLLTDKDMNGRYFDATGALPPTKSLLSTYNTDYAKTIALQETSWKRPAPKYPDKLDEILSFISIAQIDAMVQGKDPATSLKSAETNVKTLLGQ